MHTQGSEFFRFAVCQSLPSRLVFSGGATLLKFNPYIQRRSLFKALRLPAGAIFYAGSTFAFLRLFRTA